MKYLKPAKTLSQHEIDKMTAIHYLSTNFSTVASAVQNLPINDFDIESIDRLNESFVLLINDINDLLYERNKETEGTSDTSSDCRSVD